MSLDKYKDVIEYAYPDPSDIRLAWMNEKGFLAYLRGLDEKQLIEFAKLYPVWRDQRLRRCAVIKFTEVNDFGEKKIYYRVYVPKLRALRRSYYAWLGKVKFPNGLYRFITLTFHRGISIVEAWKNVNRFVSACLHRVRTKLRRMYKVELQYFWVIEAHKDGYPHVHLLLSVNKYVKGLTFEVFLKMLQESWVDDNGNRLCEPQGVDIKYLGRDVRKVKQYILKYLVKDHANIWGYKERNGLIRVRLSTLLIWAFRVRLFGASQKIKRPDRDRCYVSEFIGKTSVYWLWRFVFRSYDFAVFKRVFLENERERVDEEVVPLLCSPYLCVSSSNRAGPVGFSLGVSLN
jgi:hypothetical protein